MVFGALIRKVEVRAKVSNKPYKILPFVSI